MADGKVSLPYGQFLGYEKGEDELPQIVESEALIVRMIYWATKNIKAMRYFRRNSLWTS